MSSKMKKMKYWTSRVGSDFNRVIELNQKMLSLTRFVTKNDFFMSGSRKLMLNIFENRENNIGHVVWCHVLIVWLN